MSHLIKLCLFVSLAFVLAACSPPRPVATTSTSDGRQSVLVQVKHGYSPSVIEAQPNKPLLLKFFRDEPLGQHSCAQELAIPALHIRQTLPAQKEVVLQIPPQPKGSELGFECGMAMMKGKVRYQ